MSESSEGCIEDGEVPLLLDGPPHLLLEDSLLLVDLVQPLLHPPRPLPADEHK